MPMVMKVQTAMIIPVKYIVRLFFICKDSDNYGIFVIIAVIFRKVYQFSHIFRKKSEKRANFHEKVVTLHRDSEKSHP